MNRELQQVRRYWPRARYAGYDWHGWQSDAEPGVLYMRYSSERRWWRKRYELCLDEEQGGWRVTDSNRDQIGRGDTIAEAMRAAGFGVRPLGIMGRDPARVLADRQRPRKGARLGRRKREV